MAQINRISSFKTFSEIKASQAATQLAEENAAKRSEITAKIASLLDEMEINSFEELEEDAKREFITKAFGNVSEEEIEVEVTDEVAEEEAEEEVEVEVEEITEAIKVEGKRDAKKVVTIYNKIFNKVLVDFGAMSNESILGCIKYLMSEAMQDANFSREADPVSKMIKGNIKPLEIKMPGLGGHFVKIGPSTIKSILDKYYSDIANAAGWSGQGIVEGTALYLEQIKQEAMGQAAINKFNQAFEGKDVRINLDSKLNETNEVELITVTDETTKLEERNAFLGARAKAIEEDLEEFEFNGKTYPVTVNESTALNEGTRGQFGKIDKAGNITSVYTHYDSYPENVLPIIKKSFKGGKNVDTVIDKGANSGLDANISKINFYGDGTEATKGSVKKIDQYLKNAADDGGAEYVYLWDEGSKTWMMADIYGDMKLVPAFESVQVEEGNAFGDAVRKAKEAGETEFEFEGETYKVEEGNAFGDAVRKAKEAGETEFEFEGETFKVEESEVTEAKAWDKLNKIADEIHGEFGFASLGEDDMAKHIDLKKADKLADKMFGEFGFASLSEDEMQELINRNPKIVNESVVTEAKSFSEREIKATAEVVADAVAKVNKTKAEVIEFETLDKDGKIAGFYIQKASNKKGAPSRYWITDSGEVVSAFRHDTFGDGVVAQVGDKLASVVKTFKANESVVNEAEIKSDEEFKEYATTVLQKAFGEEYDEAKAGEVIDGILSKSDGDYGAAVGMLTSSLG